MTRSTAAGMTHGITAHGIPLGIMEAGTVGMTHGITEATGTTTIMPAGTAAGTRGDMDTTMDRVTEGLKTAGMYSTAQEIRPARTGSSAAAHRPEAASAGAVP